MILFQEEVKDNNELKEILKNNPTIIDVQIAEPTKNLGYERYKIGEVDEKELSNGAKELYGIIKEQYYNLK